MTVKDTFWDDVVFHALLLKAESVDSACPFQLKKKDSFFNARPVLNLSIAAKCMYVCVSVLTTRGH